MDPTETCAQCKKLLSDPKTLPCLHSLCKGCLEILLKENDAKKTKGAKGEPSRPAPAPVSAAADDDGPCCPQCSTIFVIPAGGVGALPADSFVLGLVKQKETASKVNPNDVKCDCDEEPAVVHCANCEAFLGERCQRTHAKSKATATHVVAKLDDHFKRSGPATRILFCQFHPASEIDTFCKTDDQPMCPSCAVPSHNSHDLVKLKDVSLDFSAEITKVLQPVRNHHSFHFLHLLH